MSLFERRPRPIPRGYGKLRDTKLFVVATEDTYAPKQYFAFFNHPRVHVEVLETDKSSDSNPQSVVSRLIDYAKEYQIGEEDQLWALLDTDHWIKGNHRDGLIAAIKDVRGRGYRVAMSNPCFDFWLLLHHKEIQKGEVIANCDLVGQQIREVKGEFNKRNLKVEHYNKQNALLAFGRAVALEENLEQASMEFWPRTTGSRVWLLISELRSLNLFFS